MSARIAGDLVVVDDEVALARTVADRFVDAAAAAIATRHRFTVALAGGSTPKAAYALLASPAYRDRVEWNHVEFFFSDERCVSPDDDQSNYRMAREALLLPLAIPEANVKRMRGEDEPERAAAAYAALLRELGGETPVLDLVMLGMGPDGHTASLFPGNDPFADESLLARARTDPYDPVATPVQCVAPVDGKLTWLVDRAAAGDLEKP